MKLESGDDETVEISERSLRLSSGGYWMGDTGAGRSSVCDVVTGTGTGADLVCNRVVGDTVAETICAWHLSLGSSSAAWASSEGSS